MERKDDCENNELWRNMRIPRESVLHDAEIALIEQIPGLVGAFWGSRLNQQNLEVFWEVWKTILISMHVVGKYKSINRNCRLQPDT